jgi:hypothetical protein
VDDLRAVGHPARREDAATEDGTTADGHPGIPRWRATGVTRSPPGPSPADRSAAGTVAQVSPVPRVQPRPTAPNPPSRLATTLASA